MSQGSNIVNKKSKREIGILFLKNCAGIAPMFVNAITNSLQI